MVKLRYQDIERILGFTLPASAFNHPEAWWSNDRDHSQAIAWLDAGYETANKAYFCSLLNQLPGSVHYPSNTCYGSQAITDRA